MQAILQALQRFFHSIVLVGGAIGLGLVAHYLTYKIAAAIAKRSLTTFDEGLVRYSRAPMRIILPLLALSIVLPFLKLPPDLSGDVEHAISLLFIASFAWLAVRLIDILQDVAASRYRIDVRDNLRARKVRTQLKIFKRIVVVVVSILAIALMLMTFSSVRQVGTSILASAGIIGIIVGFAAQKTLGNLLASIQIAFAEPMRIDDVVIIENEWGWIEDITFTYVVVRIWDLRRLIVPMSYFIEKPFQNWTRVTADLLGTVFIYVDYTVPVQAVREELHRILQSTDQWDGKAWGLQVTNATERTVELRALMSAKDSSTAWDLRCLVREKLIEFIQDKFPGGLPKVRGELSSKQNDRPEKGWNTP
jgi:small-conductance mechanosensitive channel